MTTLLSRILLAMLLFPMCGILYFVSLVVFIEAMDIDEELSFFLADVVIFGFVIVYWLALWRSAVRWESWRKWGTVVTALAGALLASALGVLVASMMSFGNEGLALFVGGATAPILWLAATILLWRETAGEKAERIRQSAGDVIFCPACGYNMTGLYEARCPECGGRLTLNQLFAAQRSGGIEESGESTKPPTDTGI